MAHDVTDFRTEVLERSRELPVLVDFWAPWCGPCRVIGPVLERLAGSADGRWALAKLNTEEHPELASEYGVMSIPNVKLFRDGRVVDEFVGALPEAEIRRWLEFAIPVPASPAVLEARARLAAGDAAGARAGLERSLAADPADAAARLALAEALLQLEPAAVEAVLTPLPDEHADRIEALRTLALWLARADALPEGAGREPFAAALAALRRGDWDGALGSTVAALQAQRGYAGNAGRELGRAIFIYRGVDDPACERHYRAFASAVNV
jgi:putative thioredoxin